MERRRRRLPGSLVMAGLEIYWGSRGATALSTESTDGYFMCQFDPETERHVLD